MKISELITVLQKDLNKHGDRRVIVWPQDRIQSGCNYEIRLRKRGQGRSKELALFDIFFC